MAIIDVVKYNGTPDVFAWKYPSEELGTWTQLIVNESQEAILFKDGRALDLFSAGRYTLETKNIPILNKVVNLPFGGRSPFAAEVWFINKAYSLDIKWGTPVPIQLQDPKYNIFIPLRSHGQFGIKINNSEKFLNKLVGTLPTFNKQNVTNFFKGMYLTNVKDAISSYLVEKKISALEINSYLNEISQFLSKGMAPILDEYGIQLLNFYVNNINIPEDDPAVIKLKAALAKRAEMDIIGYNYTQERSFDTLEGGAKNPGTGQHGLMGAGIGLSMGVGLGNIMGNQINTMGSHVQTNPQKECTKCHAKMDENNRFCPTCGFDTTNKDKKKAKTENVTCNKCKATFSKNVKFCPECGNPYHPCLNCGADLDEGALKCPSCGTKAPTTCTECNTTINSDVKFCPECGASQVKTCVKCNHLISGTPKFCPECGDKIAY